MYAVLKEVAEIRRFQVLVYNGNKVQLRIEEKQGADKVAVFEKAKKALEDYLALQGVSEVKITLAEELPQQDKNSGKYKHVVNMQK